MIRIQAARFIEEVKIPGIGERGGLSNVRKGGVNEQPVHHEMGFDDRTGVLTIRHTARSDEPVVLVPSSNIRYLEVEVEPVEAKDYASMGKEPLPPAPAPLPAVTAVALAEQPKPKGVKTSRVVVGDPDDEP